MTRLTGYFLPTEKQAPADAEALSHKLLVRAGMVRQVGTGLWSWLPAGWRVHQRASQIIREEMNAIGAHEMLMPVLLPAEPWRRSGRYEIEELFKLKDRKGADLVLAMTHEEIVTLHVAQVVRSYRDLPLMLYHIQTKERDEPRPRAGVLRTREFVMKDAYSFDRDADGLAASYELQAAAYERIFERCGLRFYRVEADVGMMGGHGADEYMAPCPAGENDVALAPGYAANVEVARAEAQAVPLPDPLDAPQEVHTPGLTTVDEVAGALALAPGAVLKAYPVVVENRGLVLTLVRGDHRVNEIKLTNALGAAWRPAHEQEVAERLGPPGFIGPVGLDGSIPIVPTSRMRTCAASSRGATSPSRARTSVASRPATSPTAIRSRSSRRSRSATSSSSARATRKRSAPRTWTSRGASSRSGWAHTASARRASPLRRSSSTQTSGGSRGRAPWLRFRSTWSRSAGPTAASRCWRMTSTRA
jgi:prolyl-tRNA synthetase